MMIQKHMIRVASIGLVAATLIGVSATAASAAPQANGSDGPVYVYDAGTGERFDETTHVFDWDMASVGSPDTVAYDANFYCPDDSTGSMTFIAPVGQARVIDSWIAYAVSLFAPGTKEVRAFAIEPASQILGSQAQIKAAGGDYEAGMACLKDNYVNFASSGVWYANIHVTKGTGAWTVSLPQDGTVTPPVDSSLQGSIDIEASAIAAVDGALSLEVPAGATATLAAPTLVNNLSTATGALPTFTVKDGRVVSMKGWDLTATVKDFTNTADAAVTIAAKQLGVAPKVVTTTADGVVAGIAHTAGSSDVFTSFASAPAGKVVGDTVLGADLTFVAPAGKAAGTYTSKLTLTLASK